MKKGTKNAKTRVASSSKKVGRKPKAGDVQTASDLSLSVTTARGTGDVEERPADQPSDNPYDFGPLRRRTSKKDSQGTYARDVFGLKKSISNGYSTLKQDHWDTDEVITAIVFVLIFVAIGFLLGKL